MARPALILDTSIVIDWILDNPDALQWATTLDTARVGVSVLTVMEVYQGARNKREMDKYGRFLSRFPALHILHEDSQWALREFYAHWLSHQIGIVDCFIAACAVRLDVPLVTLNVKDFAPLPSVQVIRPH